MVLTSLLNHGVVWLSSSTGSSTILEGSQTEVLILTSFKLHVKTMSTQCPLAANSQSNWF